MGGEKDKRKSNAKKLAFFLLLFLVIVGTGFGLHLHLSKSAVQAPRSIDPTSYATLSQSDKNAELRKAIELSDMVRVRRLLQSGANVSPQDAKGNSLLSLAFESKAPGFVLLVLERGADPNTMIKGCSALTRACRLEWREVAEALLKNGARPNGNENDCTSPLAAASTIHQLSYYLDFPKGCGSNVPVGSTATRMEIVKLLLNHGAAPSLLRGNKEKSLPLNRASKSGFREIVQLLLENGANVNGMDSRGTTALDEAALEGHTEIVRLLLDNGAEINHGTRHGSALIWAAGTPNLDTAKLLLERGADVNAKFGDGRTALMQAAQNGHVATVKLLLDNGAEIEATNSSGRSALSEANIRGHKDVVALLQSYGATSTVLTPEQKALALIDAATVGNAELVRSLLAESMGPNVRLPAPRCKTALLVAAKNGHSVVVKLLLDYGVDQGFSPERERNAESPLTYAFRGDHMEAVKVLLQNLKTIDTKFGAGLLEKASLTGDTELVKLLLDRGMSVDHVITSQDKEKLIGGETALILAAMKGHLETVSFLLDRGASPNKRSADGSTAILRASKNGHTQIVELLKARGAWSGWRY